MPRNFWIRHKKEQILHVDPKFWMINFLFCVTCRAWRTFYGCWMTYNCHQFWHTLNKFCTFVVPQGNFLKFDSPQKCKVESSHCTLQGTKCLLSLLVDELSLAVCFGNFRFFARVIIIIYSEFHIAFITKSLCIMRLVNKIKLLDR